MRDCFSWDAPLATKWIFHYFFKAFQGIFPGKALIHAVFDKDFLVVIVADGIDGRDQFSEHRAGGISREDETIAIAKMAVERLNPLDGSSLSLALFKFAQIENMAASGYLSWVGRT